jgi:hypothetical protein
VRRITASKAALVLGGANGEGVCTYWLGDDAPTVADEDDIGGAELEALRSAGTDMHKLIEEDDWSDAYMEFGADPRLQGARDFITRECGGPKNIEHEQAFGFDGEIARKLGQGRDSYATAPECTVCGTADLIANLGGGRYLVADWKSGDHGAKHSEGQMRTLGALICDAYGAIEIALASVFLEEDGSHKTYHWGTLDALDAGGILQELYTATAGEPNAGAWCSEHYCALRGRCPAFVEAGAGLLAQAPITELVRERRNPLVLGVIDDETARVAADLLPLVEKRVEALIRDLRSYVGKLDGKRLDMGDGRTFGVWPANFVDGAKALKLAEKLEWPAEEVAKFVTSKTTIDGRGIVDEAEKQGASVEDIDACTIHKREHAWTIRKNAKPKKAG